MKKHTTRALAMLLTLAMMLGMVPTAFAEATAPPAKEGTSDVTPPPAEDGTGDVTAPPTQDGTGDVTAPPTQDGAVTPTPPPSQDGAVTPTPPPSQDGTVAPTPLPADAMTLEGIVFDDRDGDGLYDPAQGDAPYASYAVDLLVQSGANPHKVLQSTTTDTDGKYSFASLPAAPMDGDAPAAYFVAAQLPGGDGERVAAQRTPYAAETFAADSDGVPGADALENASLAAADMAADPAHDSAYNLHLNLGFALPGAMVLAAGEQVIVSLNANAPDASYMSREVRALPGTLLSEVVNPDYLKLTRPGYDFGGWYLDLACTTPIGTETVKAEPRQVIYAKWTPNGKYGVKGVLFLDTDNNGLYDSKIDGTPVSATWYNGPVTLYKRTLNEAGRESTTQLASAQINQYGEYSIPALVGKTTATESYYLQVQYGTDSDSGAPGQFSAPATKTTPYSPATYKNDNDATSAGYTARLYINKDSDPTLPADYYDHINFGYAHTDKVTIKNMGARQGSVSTDKGTNDFVQYAWPFKLMPEPKKTPNAGCAFDRWTVDYGSGEQPYDFSTPFTGDVTLRAYWTAPQVDITLHSGASDAAFDGGAQTLVAGKLAVGDLLSKMLTLTGYREPTRPGYTFAGWYLNNGAYYPMGSTAVKSDAADNHLYALWTASAPYSITFAFAGGEANGSTSDIVWDRAYSGSTLESYAASHGTAFPLPTKKDCAFLGWSDGKGNAIAPAHMGRQYVTKSITYVALWRNIPGISGTAYWDNNYNGKMDIGSYNADKPLAGVVLRLEYYVEPGAPYEKQVMYATTDSNGYYKFPVERAASYGIVAPLYLNREDSRLIAIGMFDGDSVMGQTSGAEAWTMLGNVLNSSGATGQNIGYRRPHDDSYFQAYLSSRTGERISLSSPNISVSLGSSYSIADDATGNYRPMQAYGTDVSTVNDVPTMTPKKETIPGQENYLRVTRRCDSMFQPAVRMDYRVTVLGAPIVAEISNSGYYYTGTEYQKKDLVDAFTFRNVTDSVYVSRFEPYGVMRIYPDGSERDASDMLRGDSKTFTDADIGRYRMQFAGQDNYGRSIVGSDGKTVNISRSFYIHGAPHFKRQDPIHARAGTYVPGLEADGTTIIATHKHVDEKTGAVTEDEEFKASDGQVSLQKFVPYSTDGSNTLLESQATVIPTKPGKYEAYYYVRMLTANQPMHRTLYLHGNPALQVPTVIHMPPKDTPSSNPIDIDYAAGIVWSDEQLVMKNLEHVNEDGSITTYNRDNTQFYKSDGTPLNTPPAGSVINAGPIEQPAGSAPKMNIYIKGNGTNILNTPGVYPVTMVFEDTLDGMGTAGAPGSWDANKQYAYDKAKNLGYLEMKVNVIVTGTNNLPSLPSADALAYQFVMGDATKFEKLTSTPAQADIDSGKVVALSRDTDENGALVTDYYGVAAGGTIDLKTMMTRVLLSHTHDLDYESTVSTPGLPAQTKRLLRTATLSMMENNTSLSRMKVTVGGATGDTTIDNPTNAQLLAQIMQPGAADITFTVPDVRIVLKTTESHVEKPGEIVSAGNYWVILDKTRNASETYKFYTHSDMKFRLPNTKDTQVTYGLHVPNINAHAAMEVEAYFIGGKLLKENAQIPAVNIPDISKANTQVHMDYRAKHPVAPENSTLPTLREGIVTYKGTAFVNDLAQVLYDGNTTETPAQTRFVAGEPVDVSANFTAKVNKFTNITQVGENGKNYPTGTYETAQDATLTMHNLAAANVPLTGTAATAFTLPRPGTATIRYTAEDGGAAYHNGVNHRNTTSRNVTYIFDSPVLLYTSDAVVGAGSNYSMTVLQGATDEEIMQQAGATASIVPGDSPTLTPESIAPTYVVTREGGVATGAPQKLTITAKNPRIESTATREIALTAVEKPIIRVRVVDGAGAALAGVTVPDITTATPGKSYTVFAPYIPGYLLTSLSTHTVSPVRPGINEVTFAYRLPATGETPVSYTVDYTAGGKSVETLYRTGVVGADTVEVSPTSFTKGNKLYTRADGEPESRTQKMSDDPTKNVITFDYTMRTIVTEKVAYAMQYTYGGQIVRTESFVGNMGDTVTKTAPTTFVEGQYRYTIVPADAAAKTLTLTADEATNILTYAYTRADLPTGGGGGGGGGGGTVMNYALTFEVGGGTAITAVTATSGKVIPLSEYKTTRVGYAFTGWFEDSACKTPITEVKLTKNTMVYAGWKADGTASDLLTREHIAYMRGDGGAFRANSDMTRAEAAVMFYRLLKTTDVPITKHFTDVTAAEGAWYIREVETLASLSILAGYPDGRFRPDGAITRAEFATLVSRFAGLAETELSFSDVKEEHWAYHFIAAAVAQGWVNGYPDGSFRPAQNISRAEAVKIVNAVLGRVPNRAEIDKQTAPFGDVSRDFWAYYEIMEAAVPYT